MINSILCWSGGKDSTATLILAKENKIKIDKIIMSEVMFDHSRNISNEDEEHMEWVRNVAAPTFVEWGYSVEILRDKEDYLSLFNRKYKKSKNPQKNGLKWGFPLGGMCFCNNYLKVRPIDNFKKKYCNKATIEMVGIAIDEPKRLRTMKVRQPNAVSLLEQYNYTEQMALELDKSYGLLSPIYFRAKTRRSGCWNCPNQSIESFARLKVECPDKWNELEKLSLTPNLCSYGFKYGETFQQVSARVDLYIKNEAIKNSQMIMDFNDCMIV